MKTVLFSIYSLLTLLLLFTTDVNATHGSTQRSAARRSLTGPSIHRRAGLPLLPEESPNPDPSDDNDVGPSEGSSENSSPEGAPSSPSGTTSVLPPISIPPFPVPSNSDPESSSTSESSSSSASAALTSESSTTTPPPESSESSTHGGGITSILSDILSDVSSIVSEVSSVIQPPPASSEEPSSSSTTTSEEPSITPPPPEPSTSDDGGLSSILSSIISDVSSVISSVVDPPLSSSTPPEPEPSSEPPVPPSSSPSDPPVSSSEEPVPSSSVGPSSSESGISISLPSGSVSITTSVSVTTTTTTFISVPSDLTFILTESSLVIDTPSSTTEVPTMTDPDGAATTIDASNVIVSTAMPSGALPSGMPARIYPKNSLTTTPNADGSKVLISILFDSYVNWQWVVNNGVTATQIFAFMPVIVATAIGVPVSEVETWALQVYIPASYQVTKNPAQLGTTWLAYIRPDLVDTLAAQMKAATSPFYTGVPDPIAQDLAGHVVNSFSLTSVPDPNGSTKGGGGSSDSGSVTGAVNNGRSRQDAIIGVVSALGAIALLVLAFLVYRSLQRRRELAHRRLSDPPEGYDVPGARPAGREFDQDSVGGQRRRSFYFAEDSLRGFEQSGVNQANMEGGYQDNSRSSPNGMRERRVIPNAISAPILTGSSMNW